MISMFFLCLKPAEAPCDLSVMTMTCFWKEPELFEQFPFIAVPFTSVVFVPFVAFVPFKVAFAAFVAFVQFVVGIRFDLLKSLTATAEVIG